MAAAADAAVISFFQVEGPGSEDAVPENIMMSRGPQLQVLSREKRIPRKTTRMAARCPENIMHSSVLSWCRNFLKIFPAVLDMKRICAL